MLRYLIALVLLVSIQAFAPGAHPRASVKSTSAGSTFRPASLVAAARPKSAFVLRMAEGGNKQSDDGTFYDDEMDSAPEKEGISDSMRSRLMAEASTGLDSDSKQSNVLLYVIGAVGVLVVLGGAGILY